MPEFVSFEIIPKEFFFDKAAVIRAFEGGRRQSMSKIGAFIRTGARSLTGRRSKRSASPGQPPKRHAGTLHDKIYFATDAAYETLVIGALTFNLKDDVPGLLEAGGQVTRKSHGKPVQMTYHEFPYMRPSLREAINNNKLSEAWRDAVKP